MRNVLGKLSRKFKNSHFSPLKSCLYEKMWKNIVQPGRPQMTIWRMHSSCWIPKATNTHSQYVILIAFPLQQWLHERASMLRYTYSTVQYSTVQYSTVQYSTAQYSTVQYSTVHCLSCILLHILTKQPWKS